MSTSVYAGIDIKRYGRIVLTDEGIPYASIASAKAAITKRVKHYDEYVLRVYEVDDNTQNAIRLEMKESGGKWERLI